MIQAGQFDIKTGKPIQVAIDSQWQPAIKQIDHSHLEHWCQTNGIDLTKRFSVAQFYESVNDSDRRHLESESKYLVFSSGSEGYFTNRKTAQLMTLGSETVAPTYRNAVHNSVAYGGLIASDGVASASWLCCMNYQKREVSFSERSPLVISPNRDRFSDLNHPIQGSTL